MKTKQFTLFFSFFQLICISQEVINIDCNASDGNFNNYHGFLHGEVNLESKPEGLELLENAKFKYWRSSNAFDNHIIADSLGFNTTLVISDIYANSQDGYPNAQPWLNFINFEQYVSNLFNTAEQNNVLPDFWDVWNEPQSTEFWTGNYSQLIQTFLSVKNATVAINQDIKLVGPSIVSYDETLLSTFLNSLSDNGMTLDAVSWHEFGIPDSLSLHVSKFRELSQLNPQWGNPEIHINEYSPRQTNQIPGWKVGWFYHLEKSKVDWANNACWDDMNDGQTVWNNCLYGLNGILYYDEVSPLPLYWVHKAYGQMNGVKVLSEGTDSKTIAIASINPNSIDILTGRYYSIKTGEFLFPEDEGKEISNVELKIENHPFQLNSIQPIKIQLIPKGDIDFMHSPYENPEIILDSNIHIESNVIQLNLNTYKDGDSYVIRIGDEEIENLNNQSQNTPKVYPNPVNDILAIEYPFDSSWKLKLYTLNRQKIKSFSASATQIDLKNISSGIYLLQIENNENQSFTFKIVKN